MRFGPNEGSRAWAKGVRGGRAVRSIERCAWLLRWQDGHARLGGRLSDLTSHGFAVPRNSWILPSFPAVVIFKLLPHRKILREITAVISSLIL